MARRLTQCPFTEQADRRCSGHFCLNQLDYAFKYCFGAYKRCPLYRQLKSQRPAHAARANNLAAPIQVTIAGQSHANPQRVATA